MRDNDLPPIEHHSFYERPNLNLDYVASETKRWKEKEEFTTISFVYECTRNENGKPIAIVHLRPYETDNMNVSTGEKIIGKYPTNKSI